MFRFHEVSSVALNVTFCKLKVINIKFTFYTLIRRYACCVFFFKMVWLSQISFKLLVCVKSPISINNFINKIHIAFLTEATEGVLHSQSFFTSKS